MDRFSRSIPAALRTPGGECRRMNEKLRMQNEGSRIKDRDRYNGHMYGGPSVAAQEENRTVETTVVWETFASRALEGNPLGDPATRRVPILLPPGYEADASRRYPVLYALTGYTGRGAMMLNNRAWGLTLQERLDQLYAAGMPHVIAVLPD